jgi:hypothetical protein
MCPECFATIALLVTGVVSTGGVTAATLKIFRHKRIAQQISQASGQTLSAFARTNAESKEKKQ